MDLKTFAKHSVRRRKERSADDSKASVSSSLPNQSSKPDAKETDYEDNGIAARSRTAGPDNQHKSLQDG